MAFFIFANVDAQISDIDIFCLHLLQSLLISLCAIIAFTDAGIKNGCTSILIILVIVSAAEFVWIVDNTKCHVKDASIAISTVSLSLISPTMIISGSCLNAVLSQYANVYHISGFT
jgi:hypothetical protein